MSEAWRPLPGCSKRYEVSDHGRIRPLARRKPKILKPYKVSLRHWRVSLVSDAGKVVTMNVGAAVLTAFVGTRPQRHHAAHLNGDPKDNRLVNLKWALPRENCAHKRVHGTHLSGDAVFTAKLTHNQVRQIQKEALKGYSNRELANKYGVGAPTISRIVSGQRWRDQSLRRIALANEMAKAVIAVLEKPDIRSRRGRLRNRLNAYLASAAWCVEDT